MNAETFHCRSCGAAASTDAPVCAHCGARLASLACPSCFGMMFEGARFCPHCGAAAVDWKAVEGPMPCPACQMPMLQGAVSQHTVHQCGRCFGFWLDSATFGRLSADAAQQAAVLNAPPLGQPGLCEAGPVRYWRCPACADLMNRVNFARCSGVVVDVCRQHGTWFDRDELQRILLFIRSGGLDRARQREKADLAEQARRLERARHEAAGEAQWGRATARGPDLLSLVVGSTGRALGDWLLR